MEQITKRLIEVKMAMNEQEVRFRDAVRSSCWWRRRRRNEPGRGPYPGLTNLTLRII